MSNSLPKTVLEIIKSYPQGTNKQQIMKILTEQHKQWSPTSASPAVTVLERAGCVRIEGTRRDRKIFYVKDLSNRQRKARRNSNALAIDAQLGILIAIGKDKTHTMTLDEARQLYRDLKSLFKAEEHK